MDDSYAAAYAALGRNHWWWQARDRIVLDELQRRLPTSGRLRLLDVGCGDGRLFPALSSFGTVEGIEPDPITLSASASLGQIHRVPFERPLPLRGSYDVITLLDVLEHLPDAMTGLGLVHELLAPDGYVLITVPALPALWTRHDTVNHHVLRFTRTGLVSALERSGFEVEFVRYFFHGLVLPKLAVRMIEQWSRHEAPLPRTPPAVMNRLFRSWFRAEYSTTRLISRWLPGSSLIVVARPQKV